MKAVCIHSLKPKKLTALLMGLIVFSYFLYVRDMPQEFSKNYEVDLKSFEDTKSMQSEENNKENVYKYKNTKYQVLWPLVTW